MDRHTTTCRLPMLTWAAGAAAGALLSSLAFAYHPPTPAPCAADGSCLPKRATWGYYGTSWRPWPGDNAGIRPTPAATPEERGDDELGGFAEPLPQEETKAGPNQPDRDQAVPGEAAEGEPEGGFDPLPPVEPLGIRQPGLNQPAGEPLLVQPAAAQVQLGAPVDVAEYAAESTANMPAELRVLPPPIETGQPELPAADGPPSEPVPTNLDSDDPPPALPNSLRRAAAIGGGGRRAPIVTANPAPAVRRDAQVRPTAVGATLSAPAGIRVINPAAAVVAPGNSDAGPQQAIYYEATDGQVDQAAAMAPPAHALRVVEATDAE